MYVQEVSTSKIIESCCIAWAEVADSAKRIAAGNGSGMIFTHTGYSHSFVFIDEAIPLPNQMTKAFWQFAYGFKSPYPLVPWKGGQRVRGSTEPLDYVDKQGDEILQLAEVEPAQLHYGTQLIQQVKSGRGIPLSDVISYSGLFGFTQLRRSLLLSTLTLSGVAGLFPDSEEVTQTVKQNMAMFKENALIGFTGIITDAKLANEWRKVMRSDS